MAEVKALTFAGESKTLGYTCMACGLIYTPKSGITAIDAEMRAVSDPLERSRLKAETCCEPRCCQQCGKPVPKYWLSCESCRLKSRLSKCKIVPDVGDPVFDERGGGEWGDGYSSCVYEMRRWHEEEGHRLPSWVHPCTPQPLRIDSDNLVDSFEDFMADGYNARDECVDLEELEKFIDGWNEKQNYQSWYPNMKEVIVLDPVRFVLERTAG